jgi:hypothetical protein
MELEPLDASSWVPQQVEFWARILLASVKDDYPWTKPIIRSLAFFLALNPVLSHFH